MDKTTKSMYLILNRRFRFNSKLFSFTDFRNNDKRIVLGGHRTIQELFDYHIVNGGLK